ncbi:hypothetical protein BMF35_a0629 [Aurantiacibacter gangjinensis]|uniref:Uncharacterized protein n=2 Tax=Aurantiacibacter gangjinensis TaxID=502682 RepID=A0A0G9MLB8_9SPHN|nr:hypothetical protein [Aurantiacibacter gangjinensis]APE27458.1 hypothetical protein BMF35_a0629 [Aurantiacibacter gangjinensis]KLE31526.1 hypothetical protein AAW01_08130 [Aurantiacibacter gangjinensis]
MRFSILLLGSLALAACTTTPQPQAAPPPPPREVPPQVVPPTDARPVVTAPGFIAPQIMEGPGLGGIIREAAPTLLARFGQPRLDTPEGDMRKLQFRSEACVLDVYLYPLSPGAEPVATWVEARRASDGAAVDRLACIQALSVPR